jgi:hypothetical protein
MIRWGIDFTWCRWLEPCRRDAELRQRFNNLNFLLGDASHRREMVVKPENFLISPVIAPLLGTDELPNSWN